MREFLLDLGFAVRAVVRPWVRGLRGGEIVSENIHGDATFALDMTAEDAVADFVRASGKRCAVYGESTGLRRYGGGEPETLLIVDPVDGTRNASCGFEGCMVSVAAAPFSADATLADVHDGVLVDIVQGYAFSASRGSGVRVTEAGTAVTLPRAAPVDVERLRWSLNFPGRPSALLVAVMGELIDATSLTGSFHAGNSTTFALSRLVTGQLHAHVDVADRIYVDYPASARYFRPAGHTHLTGSQPHDLAAALLIVEEYGGVVTDAWGRSLQSVPLLVDGRRAMLSTIAAADATVHGAVMAYLETHLPRVRAVLDGDAVFPG